MSALTNYLISALVCVLLLVPASLMAAGPNTENLVFYLSCDDAVNPVDESADPATTVLHGSLTSVPGQFGTQALGFDGNKANRIQVLNNPKLDGMSALTVEAWAQPRNLVLHSGTVVSKAMGPQVGHSYTLWTTPDRNVYGRINGNESTDLRSTTTLEDGVWYHLALVFDGQSPANERMKLYANGVLDSTHYHPGARVNQSASSVWVGDVGEIQVGFTWEGALDEIGIWNTALTAAQVREVMYESKAQLLNGDAAQNPVPASSSDDAPIHADLAWTPGRYAATHNVYFSSSWADVNAAEPTVLAAEGLARDDSRLSVGPLDYGRAYYWRVDEVNAAPDATVYEGAVWSFTTEPYAYPLTSVTATASSRQRGMTPDRTVDGSGLDQSEAHSTAPTDMWLSQDAVPQWIIFALDKVYALHEMWIWNSNQLLEPILGFGARDVTIDYSTDGTAWTALEGVSEFAQASGIPSYTANTVVDFGSVRAQYVRLTINSNWGGIAAETGLSEVRFFYIPLQARQPQPAVGATGVNVDTELNWRPGREAQVHEVYLGIAPDALVRVDTLADPRCTPGLLDFGTTYYWRVDEVGGAGPYEGDVWSFTTQDSAAAR